MFETPSGEWAIRWADWCSRSGAAAPRMVGLDVSLSPVGDIVAVGVMDGRREVCVAKVGIDGLLVWVRLVRGAGFEDVRVVVDRQSNTVVAGRREGPIVSGATELPAGDRWFLLKLDSRGTTLWIRPVAGVANIRGLAVGPGGDIVAVGAVVSPWKAGATTGRGVYVGQYSPSGKQRWRRRLGWDALDNGRAVGVDKHGNVVITGQYDGDLRGKNVLLYDRDGHVPDIYVAKLTPSGEPLWAVPLFGSKGSGYPLDVAVDRNGQVAVLVRHMLWEEPGNTRTVLNVLSASGEPVGDVPLFSVPAVFGVRTDGAGRLYLYGYAAKSVLGGKKIEGPCCKGRAFIVALSPKRRPLWARGAVQFVPRTGHVLNRLTGRTVTIQSGVGVSSMAVGPAGDVVVIGSFSGAARFGNRYLLARSTGESFLWRLPRVFGRSERKVTP